MFVTDVRNDFNLLMVQNRLGFNLDWVGSTCSKFAKDVQQKVDGKVMLLTLALVLAAIVCYYGLSNMGFSSAGQA